MKILGQNAHWIINKDLARVVGIQEALLLSDFIDKSEYFRERGQLSKDGFFFNTSSNIEEDTTLSYAQQKSCIKNLKNAGFIEVDICGIPAKLHFKVNENKVLDFLNSSINKANSPVLEKVENKYLRNSNTCVRESGKLVLEKVENYINNNKEIIIKEEGNTCQNETENLESEIIKTENKKEELVLKVTKLISEKESPTTKIDQARLVFYFIEKLRKKQSRDVPYYLDKIQGLIDKGFSVEDIIKASWNLNHNDFAMGQNSRGWVWDYSFLFKKGSIDEALNGRYKIKITPTSYALGVLGEVSYLFKQEDQNYGQKIDNIGTGEAIYEDDKERRAAQLRKLESYVKKA